MLRLPSIAITPTRPRRALLLGASVAAVPLVGAAWSFVATPGFFEARGYRRPELFDIPIQLIIMAFAVAWRAIGGYVVGTSRSPWVLPVVLLLFTLPACLAIIFEPAIILILQNLGA